MDGDEMDIEVVLRGKKISENEKSLLIYIINNVSNLNGVGVREIAKRNYTSASAIIRLAQKLGFSGYTDLFYYLKNNIDGGDPVSTNDNIFSRQIEKLQSLYHQNKNKFIFIYATGFSAIIAEYLYKKLLVKGIKVVFSSAKDSSGILENNTENISMCFVISKSGETPKLIEKIKFLKEKGIPIILLSGNNESTASFLSNINFIIQDNNRLDTHNKEYNLFFGELMLLIENIVYKVFY